MKIQLYTMISETRNEGGEEDQCKEENDRHSLYYNRPITKIWKLMRGVQISKSLKYEC